MEKEEKKVELEYSDIYNCPNCDEPFIIRTSKKNTDYQYLGCRNWKDKACQGFYNVETGEKVEFGKKKKRWKNK